MVNLENDNVKIEVLRLANEGLSNRQIQEVTGVGRTAINRFLRKTTYKTWWDSIGDKPIAGGEVKDHHNNIRRMEGNRFILTSAQNSTFCHLNFLKSLETAAEFLDAKIIIGTFSYNKSAFQNLEKGDGNWFDPMIVDYIIDEPVLLADDLLWCGELNILPTAVNPLSGLQSYTKWRSGIIPHAKVHLESLPTHKSKPTRMMYTTGAITKRNYIQKKAGQKASFHHVFGALLVEIDNDGNWFVRQLVAETSTGHFQDLDVVYTPEGVKHNQRVEAINWGDIHVDRKDECVYDVAFKDCDESILNFLKPKYQFLHDIYDANRRSHHHVNDPHTRFELHIRGMESVSSEVKSVGEFINYVSRDYCQTVVVDSNHDRALERWLREADYKKDYVNALYFLQLQLIKYTAISNGDDIRLLEEAILLSGVRPDAKFLALDESFLICNNIECGMHGDIGISGARGSAQALTKLDSRANIGHSHSAKIVDGVYQAGTMTVMDLGYNKGPSTWSNSIIITYPNGKRTISTIKNGKWKVG